MTVGEVRNLIEGGKPGITYITEQQNGTNYKKQ